MKPRKFVFYKGNRIAEIWANLIEEGQRQPTVTLAGRTYERSRVGEEKQRAPDQQHCPGCLAARGQYHSTFCTDELCPRCGEQLVFCTCPRAPMTIAEMTYLVSVIDAGVSRIVKYRELIAEDLSIAQRNCPSVQKDTIVDEFEDRLKHADPGLLNIVRAIQEW